MASDESESIYSQRHFNMKEGLDESYCDKVQNEDNSEVRVQSLWRVKPPHDLLAEKYPIPLDSFEDNSTVL